MTQGQLMTKSTNIREMADGWYFGTKDTEGVWTYKGLYGQEHEAKNALFAAIQLVATGDIFSQANGNHWVVDRFIKSDDIEYPAFCAVFVPLPKG